VAASRETLFGKIALAQGYCTQDQLDECLSVQLRTQSPQRAAPKLGELLIEKGYLTAEQLDTVLSIQKQNADITDPNVRKRKESVLFGKLAVREGLTTEERINECLRLQDREGETRTLGEILVAKSYLTAAQVKDLLGRQLKRIMLCPACKLSFTVLSMSEGRKVDCPRCKGPLQEKKSTDSTRTDAEFATQVIRAVRAGVPASPPPRPAPRESARRVRATCVICDHAFEAPLGPDGRVQCAQCHTTFTPR
jgi:hypothetical protein